MAVDYAKYLAGAIITESQIVTYRLLSRALKVHHSEAKRMLFDFHRQQNAKKPGSIHATYLVTGTQVLAPQVELSQNGHTDSPMPGSSFMSSFAAPGTNDEVEPVKQRVLTLAKEENLEAAKAKYEIISSVHVYSLELNTLQNLEMLSAVTQRIMTEYIAEDPLIHNKTYGVIQNPNVKRRSGARPIPQPLPIKEETKSAFAKTKDPKTSDSSKTLSKPKEAPPGSGEQATKIGAPSLIKRESSDLFKSFAKAKPKSKPTPASKDVQMKDASDEDEDEDTSVLPEPDAQSEARRKTRLEQKEKMRKWMEEEDDDESMQDIKPTGPASQPEADPEPETNAEAEPESEDEPEEDQASAPIDAPKAKNEEDEEEEEETPATVSGGRRRGRRKVMKKKMTRDAEGYLVTKEEPVWESFSEDEAPTSSIKAKASIAGASAAAKAKKGPGKPGQGNIMNFFGKK